MRPLLLLGPLLAVALATASPAAAAPGAGAPPLAAAPPEAPGRGASYCVDPVHLTVGAHSVSTPLVCVPWT